MSLENAKIWRGICPSAIGADSVMLFSTMDRAAGAFPFLYLLQCILDKNKNKTLIFSQTKLQIFYSTASSVEVPKTEEVSWSNTDRLNRSPGMCKKQKQLWIVKIYSCFTTASLHLDFSKNYPLWMCVCVFVCWLRSFCGVLSLNVFRLIAVI